MNKSNEEIKQDWERLDDDLVTTICGLLNQYEYKAQDYLADWVASLCDVDKRIMLTASDKSDMAHARWFFWYAYRYMTNESYDKIAEMTKHNGYQFTSRGVISGVNKMSMMIANEPMWTKRWVIIKRIIKQRFVGLENSEKSDSTAAYDGKVVVNVPKELKNKVKILFND